MNPKYQHIFQTVCDVVGVNPDAVDKKIREPNLVRARQLYFYFARKLEKMSYREIGESLKVKKDHATVLFGIKKIEGLVSLNLKPESEWANEISLKLNCKMPLPFQFEIKHLLRYDLDTLKRFKRRIDSVIYFKENDL